MPRVSILCALGLLLMLLLPPAQGRAGGLALGFLDDIYKSPDDVRGPWLDRTVAAGADLVRLQIGWVAADTPKPPAGFNARDPTDPNYDFSVPDAEIRAASAAGLRVLLSFTGAPRWAEGAKRPASAPPGTWRPQPTAVEQWAEALVTRYSGRFPDPLQPGHTLPRVAAFQVWNEPNLNKYLTPQWSAGRTDAPAQYRHILNAFYRGAKAVDPQAVVVTAGTAPFGDPAPGGNRIMPVRFVRDLLCLRQEGSRVRGTACPDPAHFDVLAHHPYSVGAPTRSALNADDVSIPDLGKLTRLLRVAERTGGALPRTHHRLWVTEVAYDSSPPDPQGVPIADQARYLEQTLYLLWRQGVDTAIWYQVGDQSPVPSYAETNQSGVYYLDGRPKPALTAFRFPLVAERSGARRLRVWGRSPTAGALQLERRTASGWTRLRAFPVHAHGTFVTVLHLGGPAALRARVGDDVSLTWQTN